MVNKIDHRALGQKVGLIILCFFLFGPVRAHADDSTPVEINLFHPAQIFNDGYSVSAFRLDFLYGVNENITGLDLGFINYTKGNAQALEMGIFNRVDEDFDGWQFGMVNEVKEDFNGLQVGVLTNVTQGTCQGLQASVFFNDAKEKIQGVQLGIVNATGSLDGVQIGLFNFNDDEKYLGFFPFIHAAF